MSKGFRMKYFKSIHDRYQQASKKLKTKILDEFCKVCAYDRKYAIAKLNGPPIEDQQILKQKANSQRCRPKIYSDQTIDILGKVWEAANYPCSIRLKPILQLWLPWIEKRFQLKGLIKQQLLAISPRQMDRRLQRQKKKAKRRIYGGTKPGTLLKHQIPIKTDHWDVKTPGFTEIDTVSHSGNSASGLYTYSVNQTDILTGWVETRAVLGKGEKDVGQAIEEMEQFFPFKILGIDTDNGSEFINHHLQKVCKSKTIQFTRGRPYEKNDNAHIEQKNWTHVRKIFGWNRFDTPKGVKLMNDLYSNELRLFMNLYLPSSKLLNKKRVGSQTKRQHDDPRTPLDRLISFGQGDKIKVEQLNSLRKMIDPFNLSAIIDKKVEHILKLANHRHSPKLPSAKPSASLSQMELEVFAEISKILGTRVLEPISYG